MSSLLHASKPEACQQTWGTLRKPWDSLSWPLCLFLCARELLLFLGLACSCCEYSEKQCPFSLYVSHGLRQVLPYFPPLS